jgi:hypothetical protein
MGRRSFRIGGTTNNRHVGNLQFNDSMLSLRVRRTTHGHVISAAEKTQHFSQCAPALSMARRDFPVPLAPFGTRRHGCAFASGGGTPPPGRTACASGARETLAHNGLTARGAGCCARQPCAYRGLLASVLRAFRGSQRWTINESLNLLLSLSGITPGLGPRRYNCAMAYTGSTELRHS